jgi:hypothetical protein
MFDGQDVKYRKPDTGILQARYTLIDGQEVTYRKPDTGILQARYTL